MKMGQNGWQVVYCRSILKSEKEKIRKINQKEISCFLHADLSSSSAVDDKDHLVTKIGTINFFIFILKFDIEI